MPPWIYDLLAWLETGSGVMACALAFGAIVDAWLEGWL